MTQSALYFPHINVPTTQWTVQSILYWDTLKSIVPMEQLQHPEALDPLTRELLAEGLVESIIPGRFLWQVERFRDAFVDYLESQRIRSRIDPGWSFAGQPSWKRIHFEKMGDIAEYLVDAGLARRIDYCWFEVEPRVANRFMCYLACVLAALPEVQATAVTDRLVYAAGLRPTTARRGQLAMHGDKARDAVLRFLLPLPAEPPAASSLLKFKDRHGHLLPAFRAKVEGRCAEIAHLATAEDRYTATVAFIKECADERDEIEAAMRPDFGKIVFVSLLPLFGNGLVLKALDPDPTEAVIGATMVLANAAYVALDSVRGPRRLSEKRPLAYVAAAGTHLGLRK